MNALMLHMRLKYPSRRSSAAMSCPCFRQCPSEIARTFRRDWTDGSCGAGGGGTGALPGAVCTLLYKLRRFSRSSRSVAGPFLAATTEIANAHCGPLARCAVSCG